MQDVNYMWTIELEISESLISCIVFIYHRVNNIRINGFNLHKLDFKCLILCNSSLDDSCDDTESPAVDSELPLIRENQMTKLIEFLFLVFIQSSLWICMDFALSQYRHFVLLISSFGLNNPPICRVIVSGGKYHSDILHKFSNDNS